MSFLNSTRNPRNQKKKKIRACSKKKTEKEITKTQTLGLFQLYPNGYKISHAFMRAVTVIIYTYTNTHPTRCLNKDRGIFLI